MYFFINNNPIGEESKNEKNSEFPKIHKRPEAKSPHLYIGNLR
jgi:hypothetical protein